MDISDFLFVGQWKVSGLTMSALLQRLGRAARNLLLKAIFALFVEPKHFDREQLKLSRKRSADTQARPIQHPCSPGQPCNRSTDVTTEASSSRALITSSRPPTLAELKKVRKAVYAEHYKTQSSLTRRSAKSKAPDELDPAIDDLVNAPERGFGCRRVPPNITFDNDELGEFFLHFKQLRLSIIRLIII